MAFRAHRYPPVVEPPEERLPAAAPALARGAPEALSVLRIVAALVYWQHGLQKLFNFPPSPRGPMPFVFDSLIGVAGVIETFAGVLLILGLLTRPVAFITCGEMAVAYFKAHFPRGFFPINNMGETPVLLCFIFLLLIFAGAGPWSLDALIAKRLWPVKLRA
ncbi:MAG TPA: DoxX family protein [Gemmatimonadaceae bacterium]|jgi:putative oxidoreductase|nr:DoxX family protein [Gemmatimonadaceae bacterium]